MKTLLHISASPNGDGSHSKRFGDKLVASFKRLHAPDIIERDLTLDPLPYPGRPFVRSSLMREVERDCGAVEALALSEVLIREVEQAYAIVIDTPMHNFMVPAALKTWIDHVVRPLRTFQSSVQGKVGMLRRRPVFVVIACGGGFDAPGEQIDFLTPYLLHVLATIGLQDIQTLRLDSLRRGDAAVARAYAQAEAWIEAHVGRAELTRSIDNADHSATPRLLAH